MNKKKLFEVFNIEIEECGDELQNAAEALLSSDAEPNRFRKEERIKAFTTTLGNIQIHLANIDTVLIKIEEKLRIAELDALCENVEQIHGWVREAVKCCSSLKKSVTGKTELTSTDLADFGLLKLNIQHTVTRGAKFLNGTVKEVLCTEK